MKLHYDPQTDSLYIELQAGPGVETREIADGLNVDLDGEGHAAGIDVDAASTRMDLSTLEAVGLPTEGTKVA